jgi:hypothetical protein
MIDKYVDSHTIIICGDVNGSLSNERNNLKKIDTSFHQCLPNMVQRLFADVIT